MQHARAWQGLLVAAWLLLATSARADPEVWLVVGPIATTDGAAGFGPSGDAFRPEAGAFALHEHDVVPMPTCDAPLTFGLRPARDASAREQIVVRLLQRRTASGCALDVLTVATTRRRGTETPQATGTSSLPAPTGDLRHENARALPCGSRLIVLREGPMRGSSGSLAGLGETGECAESTDGMLSPLGIRWLGAPRPDS